MSKPNADWVFTNHLTSTDLAARRQEIIDLLLASRGISSSDRHDFLNPTRPGLEIIDQLPDLDKQAFYQAIELINKSIAEKRPIIVYGDYDCDGVSATAILWESINDKGGLVRPFIPHRVDHGYGLSVKGTTEAISKIKAEFPDSPNPLFITVDNGITAIDIVESLKASGMLVIVTDHHQPKKILPTADAIVHTTALCGSGVAWLLASFLQNKPLSLDLVALATVCDLLPLTGLNRRLVKFGLIDLQNTKRPGMKALFQVSGLQDATSLSAYHLGFVIGPRINAIGRLGHAFDALRLMCTNDSKRAFELAQHLSEVNQLRQDLTDQFAKEAISQFASLSQLPNILVVKSTQYHEGIIGLIASKLTESYSRPAMAIAIGETVAKGSARSVIGVDITSLLTEVSQHILEFGGHTQAAGFALDPIKIDDFINALLKKSESIDSSLLKKSIKIDMEVSMDDLDLTLINEIEKFAPFGIGNPKPVFAASLPIADARVIGKNRDHLLVNLNHKKVTKAVGFGMGELLSDIHSHELIKAVFNFELDTYNGNRGLQLLLKAIR